MPTNVNSSNQQIRASAPTPTTKPSLVDSLRSTNLDTTNPSPFNTPADPSIYPKTTRSSTAGAGFNPTPGKPAKKFEQKYSSNNTYLDSLDGYI